MKNESFQLKVEDTFHEIIIDVYDDRKETIGFFRSQDISNPQNSFARLVYHRGLEACRCIPSYIDDDAHYSPGFCNIYKRQRYSSHLGIRNQKLL